METGDYWNERVLNSAQTLHTEICNCKTVIVADGGTTTYPGYLIDYLYVRSKILTSKISKSIRFTVLDLFS
jgi:hypothetical protein